MNCEFHTDADKLIAVLSGEIDHHQVAPVRERIDEKIEAQKPKELVLDFTDISFMDSSGIGLIMGRYKKMRECDGYLSIKNPSPNTLRVLKLAGMDRLAKIEKGE